MARTLALRASAGLVAGMAMAAITLAPGARAETGEQFPGDGVFLVGTDIAPGTYRTEGPSNPPYFGVRQGVRALNLLMVDTQRTRGEQ